jgi:hypothetical protein
MAMYTSNEETLMLEIADKLSRLLKDDEEGWLGAAR